MIDDKKNYPKRVACELFTLTKQVSALEIDWEPLTKKSQVIHLNYN